MKFSLATLVGLLWLTLAGCAPKGPSAPLLKDEEVRQTLAARASAVRTISARCEVRMRSPDGQSVQLEGAMAAEPPNRFRLRTWKLSRAVFDLTLNPDGLHLQSPDDLPTHASAALNGLSAERFGRAWSAVGGAMFSDPATRLVTSGDRNELVFIQSVGDHLELRAVVNRAGPSVRGYELVGEGGKAMARIDLDRYRTLDGIPWPTHLRAWSESGGTLELWLSEIELNASLAENAFRPPRSAVRLP